MARLRRQTSLLWSVSPRRRLLHRDQRTVSEWRCSRRLFALAGFDQVNSRRADNTFPSISLHLWPRLPLPNADFFRFPPSRLLLPHLFPASNPSLDPSKAPFPSADVATHKRSAETVRSSHWARTTSLLITNQPPVSPSHFATIPTSPRRHLASPAIGFCCSGSYSFFKTTRLFHSKRWKQDIR